MTKKLQRMTPNSTPNPTNPNPTLLNCSKNDPQKSQKLPPIFGRIIEGRIEGRIHPCQKKKKSEHPALHRPAHILRLCCCTFVDCYVLLLLSALLSPLRHLP
jgi:hypothetical protein